MTSIPLEHIDLPRLTSWIGKTETQTDDITLFPAKALAAALDHHLLIDKGDELPPFWEWLYFLPTPRASATGADGHPQKGGFLPPVPLPRRMWAAGEVSQQRPIRVGLPATRNSKIESVDLKQGKSGTLIFVKVHHSISQNEEICVSQIQNIVYREHPAPDAPLPPPQSPPANPDWQLAISADPVLLFRYSALTYNGHRIHYDRTYATEQEFYPGLVVHGPLLVTLLLNQFQKQHPEIKIANYNFKAVRPTFDQNRIGLAGKLNDNTFELWSSDQDNALCMKIQGTLK
ncbi:transcriptional regulator LysR family [Oleiphilus messinensis]|uniref:Transcriptional regulator LysR family n=1 Tax=Oleiphilus messinensis TaxID=141451 RepID=A0A1Y0I717_9GAMM|nr:MaoC family dehydratase N-terminal domain-containing protein [Oleiphilus messinensis]ARU56241.1 transcriptional regulator LysR family [Oleiphilus messinensis]